MAVMETETVDKPSRAFYVAKIKKLETALAALPEGDESFVATRKSILDQIEVEKKCILTTKSTAAQIEGCRAAIARAQQRKAKHEAVIVEATNMLTKEEENITRLAAELKDMEASFAANCTVEQSPQGSIQEATTALTKLVNEMSGTEAVPREHVAETVAIVQRLLAGVNAIAAAVTTSVSAAPPEAHGPQQPEPGLQPAALQHGPMRIRTKTEHASTPYVPPPAPQPAEGPGTG